MHPRGIYRKSANYTVTADDNGLLFLATAAVTFTLPTKPNGLAFRFAADGRREPGDRRLGRHRRTRAMPRPARVTFSTANEKIGSHVLVECMYTAAGTLKWLVTQPRRRRRRRWRSGQEDENGRQRVQAAIPVADLICSPIPLSVPTIRTSFSISQPENHS